MAQITDFAKGFGINFSENGLMTPSWSILLLGGGGGGPQVDFEGGLARRAC